MYLLHKNYKMIVKILNLITKIMKDNLWPHLWKTNNKIKPPMKYSNNKIKNNIPRIQIPPIKKRTEL
jgi:hypothetical protein